MIKKPKPVDRQEQEIDEAAQKREVESHKSALGKLAEWFKNHFASKKEVQELRDHVAQLEAEARARPTVDSAAAFQEAVESFIQDHKEIE